MRRCLPLFFSLVALLLLAACSDGGEAQTVACVTDADCPQGQTCAMNQCRTLNIPDTDGDEPITDGDIQWHGECRFDQDCGPGYVCRQNFCIPSDLVDDDPLDGDVPVDGDQPADGDDPVDGDQPADGDDPVDGDLPSDGDIEDGDTDDEGLPCKVHADCNDGLFCNGTELCGENNRCIPGTPPCDDGVDCTDNVCDEENNQCYFVPNNAFCDDGNICNGLEVCDRVLGCVPGTPPICDDGIACTQNSCHPIDGCLFEPDDTRCDDNNPCTVDTCDPDMGGCVHTPTDSLCDDGIACTVNTCSRTEGCITEPSHALCDDGFSCTVDRCLTSGCENRPDHNLCSEDELCNPQAAGANPTTGCVPRPECYIDADCDDGLWCNGVETCVNLRCVPGTPIDCDDGIACTQDRCDEANQRCEHIPQHHLCSDGNVCNGIEICSPEVGCMPGTPLNCDDGIACTEDRCDPETGCINRPVHSLCNDGINCTVDFCSLELGCINQPDNSFCDDLVPCTVDVCNPTQGCIHTPNDAYCDDGIACTNATCTPQYNCVYEAVHSRCNDGIACTTDTCEIGVGCKNQPNDSMCLEGQHCSPTLGCVERPQCVTDADCSDNNVCNGTERCVSGRCYQGTPLNCNDNIACTIDSCNPISGCVHTPNHAVCEDNDPCTTSICIPGYGCHHEVTKDSDGDNYIDANCPGGTDCNDYDPLVNPGMTEICDDGKDNNCNGLTDMEDPACSCGGGCPTGQACCEGRCVDILLNNDHCGGCGKFCATACWNGQCKPAGKCATALRNLITTNRTIDSNTCGGTNQFDARNNCSGASSSSNGPEHIYAVKPIRGNDMRVYHSPSGFNSDQATMYILSDCWNPSSCVNYTWASDTNPTLRYTPDKNSDAIFFVVLDSRQGRCGSYRFRVDYDYTPSDCRQGGLIPISGPSAILATLAFWALFVTLLWRRRVRA